MRLDREARRSCMRCAAFTGRAARARRRRRSRARARPSGRTGRLARRPSPASPPRGVATISSLVAPAARASATACWNDEGEASTAIGRGDAHERRGPLVDDRRRRASSPPIAIASSSASSCTASRRRCSLVLVHCRRRISNRPRPAGASSLRDEIRRAADRSSSPGARPRRRVRSPRCAMRHRACGRSRPPRS